MRTNKDSRDARWFIWTIVGIVVILGGLAAYIYFTANASTQLSTERIIHHKK